MKVSESSVNMASSREYRETDRVKQERGIRWETVLSDRQGADPPGSPRAEFRERLTIMRIEAMTMGKVRSTDASEGIISLLEQQNALLNSIFESLFPGDSDSFGGGTFSFEAINLAVIPLEASGREPGMNFTLPTRQKQPVLRYTSYETTVYSHHEKEETNFASDGVVTTADGRQIDFTLGLKMDREFLAESRQTIEESGIVKLLDPLVVNFDGNLPALSDMTFDFDLNADGEMDEISRLLSGSGFLAFDQNEDGVINDGSELFGALTDDGFKELAEYDEDGNNWIDENDAIFDHLSVWRMEDEEEDTLASLREAGVGAIHLAGTETLFDLTDDDNNLLGRVEKTGVFLEEDGDAGTIQQLKFAVSPPTSVA